MIFLIFLRGREGVIPCLLLLLSSSTKWETLQEDVFEQVKIHVCKRTFFAFFSSPPFFAPNNAFSCIAITYSPFAICAARLVAIPTVLPYNTSCKNIMIQLCAVYFLWKPKNIIHLTKFIWKKNQVLTLS